MSRWTETRWHERLFLTIVSVGCAWRGMWLAAGVPDTTGDADAVRSHLQSLVADEPGEVSTVAYFNPIPESTKTSEPSNWRLHSRQRFDPDAEVWIVPGADDQPGWAGWDDNQNGIVDDDGELGAAWSDDHCVTPATPEFRRLDRSRSRVINRGAYVPVDSPRTGLDDERIRYLFTNQAAADSR